MKINGHIITSLTSFRSHFNLFEVWHKKNIFIRDLSPDIVPYKSDEDKIYYCMVSNPTSVKFSNATEILCNDFSINISKEESEYIKDFAITDKIQIIALSRLARCVIPKEFSHFATVTRNGTDNKIIELSYGESLSVNSINIKEGLHLETKLIVVSKNSNAPSIVGSNVINPGEVTYGVFCRNELIAVCPNWQSNNLYRLTFLKNGQSSKLIVTDRTSDMTLLEYPNAHWFVKISDDNFAIIDGKSVLCINNEDLNRRIRGKVERAFSPTMLRCDDINLYIVYANGKEDKIII